MRLAVKYINFIKVRIHNIYLFPSHEVLCHVWWPTILRGFTSLERAEIFYVHDKSVIWQRSVDIIVREEKIQRCR